MDSQVNAVSRAAWCHLHRISHVRRYLSIDQAKSAIHAYVTSRLDQNNSLLVGIPSYLIVKLQKIQNAAAKILLGGNKHDHVTPLLMQLHWLPMEQRVPFKILLLVYKVINGKGPCYLHSILCDYKPQRQLWS